MNLTIWHLVCGIRSASNVDFKVINIKFLTEWFIASTVLQNFVNFVNTPVFGIDYILI